MVFAWGSAAMIAVGRDKFDWDTTRYQTVTLQFWLSLAVLGVLALRRPDASFRRASAGVLLAATLWLAFFLFPAHLKSRQEMKLYVAEMRAANTAILVGIPQPDQYVKLLPRGDRRFRHDSVEQYRELLLNERLGVFSTDHHDLLGQRLEERYRIEAGRTCEGGLNGPIFALRRSRGNSTLRGWVSGEAARNLDDTLFVVSDDGEIVGFARILYQQFDPLGLQSHVRKSWIGYARADTGTLDVLAVTRDGRICSVVENEPITAMKPLRRRRTH
jgi:hypothetical protein